MAYNSDIELYIMHVLQLSMKLCTTMVEISAPITGLDSGHGTVRLFWQKVSKVRLFWQKVSNVRLICQKVANVRLRVSICQKSETVPQSHVTQLR